MIRASQLRAFKTPFLRVRSHPSRNRSKDQIKATQRKATERTTERKRKAVRMQWPRAKLAVDGAEIVRDDPGLAEGGRGKLGKDSGRERERERRN